MRRFAKNIDFNPTYHVCIEKRHFLALCRVINGGSRVFWYGKEEAVLDQKKIGGFLKELRKEKGMTQEQLVEYLNVSGRTMSRWETESNEKRENE